jgi:hypothetical protein
MHLKQLHSVRAFPASQNNGFFARLTKVIYFPAIVFSLLLLGNEGQCSGALTETQLVFYPLSNQAFQRDFGFVPGALSNGPISFLRHDLVDSSSRGVIPSSEIAIEPSSGTAPLNGANFLFHVTVKGPPRAGTYSGKLEVNYPSAASGTIQTTQLELICYSTLPPSLEADSAATMVLNATKGTAFEAFFIGSKGVCASNHFQLQQTVDSPAEILAVYPSSFRSAKGLSFCSNSLVVTPTGPVALSGREGKNFDISIIGQLPQAGEYNGTIIANVRNQSALIKVPVKVQIKNGWLLPFVILLAGLLVAMLIPWWNSTGKELSELMDKTVQEIAYLPKQPRLQVADRERVSNHFHDVLRAIDAGLAVEQVRALYQRAQDDITATTKDTVDIIASLDPLANKVATLPDADAFKRRLQSLLADLATGLDRGTFVCRADAKDSVQKITNEIATAQTAAAEWNALDSKKGAEFIDQWRKAATIQDLRQVLAQATPPMAGAAAVVPPPAPPAAALPPTATAQLSNPFYNARRRLLLGKLAVSVFLWIVILWGGMVMLYASSPTFGSDPKDYISLFFWGASSEVVRGQVINLSGLKGALKL